MGKLKLYGLHASPPFRAALFTLEALDLPFEFVEVNVLKSQQHSKEYLEKNPQHTVPTLEDDGHFIWDSHAIMAYLVRKYGKDDSLYPNDFLKRAVVDQRLHFESGVVFQGAVRSIVAAVLFRNQRNIPQYKIDAIIDVYNLLETFLKDNNYIAGNQLTIADFSLITSTTALMNFAEIDASKYPKLSAWIQRMQKLPYYQECNGKGAEMFARMVKSRNIQIGKKNASKSKL